MRYLATLLLTTTFLTNTTTYGAADIEYDKACTQTSVSIETKDKIDAFRQVVRFTEEFNISDATELLFDPALYPYISWKSAEKNENVIEQVRQIIREPSRENHRQYMMLLEIFCSIKSPDPLEKITHSGPITSPLIENPTMLNSLIEGTETWGHYRHFLTRFPLTFYPEVRLKLYLELLDQINITPDSLDQILTATAKLANMFMTEPSSSFSAATLEAKNTITDNFGRSLRELQESSQWFSKFAKTADTPTPDLWSLGRFIDNNIALSTQERIRALSDQVLDEFASTFSDFEKKLDAELETTNETFKLISKSFAPNTLELFEKIFNRIATHPTTKTKDRIRAGELLIQAGGSSYPLVSEYFQLASDPSIAIDNRLTSISKLSNLNATSEIVSSASAIAADATLSIENRLYAANVLSEIDSAKPAAAAAYELIWQKVNSQTSTKEEKSAYLLEIGIGFHKVGDVNKGVSLLAQSLQDLITEINSKKHLSGFNPDVVITTIEILFNAGRFEHQKTIAEGLLLWVIYQPVTGAWSQGSIIFAAEVAERMGSLDVCKKCIDHLQNFEARETYKDRIAALNAKLSTAAAS